MRITGYVHNAAIICPDCARSVARDSGKPDDDESLKSMFGRPQFDTDETDGFDSCDACGEFIVSSLTSYGLDYVLNLLREDVERGERNNWANTVANELRWYPLDSAQQAIVDAYNALPART